MVQWLVWMYAALCLLRWVWSRLASSQPACLPPRPRPPRSQQLSKLRAEIRSIVASPQHCLPFLQPGRLVRVLPPPDAAPAAAASPAAEAAAAAAAARGGGSAEGALAAVVNFELVGGSKAGDSAGEGSSTTSSTKRGTKQYLVDVLCNCSEESLRHQGATRR
jgi:ATP-dependent RNA helicase DOB1